MTEPATYRSRIDDVAARIAAACSEAGRATDDVRIVAVSKYAELDQIVHAFEAGHRDFGENYVQAAFEKMDVLGEPDRLGERAAEIRWHMIGGIQSNKAARAARRFALIHTLASLKAARAISRAIDEEGREASVLVQVHLGGGEQRAGLGPEEVESFLEGAAALPALRVLGLMGVAPAGEPAREHFARLGGLFDAHRDAYGLTELSMGMSGDYEDAVREGATLVRVGSAIFSPDA